MTYREALRSALRDALRSDPRVFLMGEDVGRYGGAFAVTHGLLEEFGSERVRDTPLSESAFVGAGIGGVYRVRQRAGLVSHKSGVSNQVVNGEFPSWPSWGSKVVMTA